MGRETILRGSTRTSIAEKQAVGKIRSGATVMGDADIFFVNLRGC
jgi:hypothetical protein